MEKIKITLELTAQEVTNLLQYLNGQKMPVKEPEEEEQITIPATVTVTKNLLRAKGIEITKAGKQDQLKAAFEKFGATKLSEVDEASYEDLYKELEEI